MMWDLMNLTMYIKEALHRLQEIKDVVRIKLTKRDETLAAYMTQIDQIIIDFPNTSQWKLPIDTHNQKRLRSTHRESCRTDGSWEKRQDGLNNTSSIEEMSQTSRSHNQNHDPMVPKVTPKVAMGWSPLRL